MGVIVGMGVFGGAGGRRETEPGDDEAAEEVSEEGAAEEAGD